MFAFPTPDGIMNISNSGEGGNTRMAVTMKLPVDLETRLNNLAAVTHRPKSHYLREALEEYLTAHEDKFIALSRLEKPAQRWTLDELEQGRDLES
jgi:RHH-type rel operon transcriptional repressor/antitoxin RelB